MSGKKYSKVRWKTNIGCREATEKYYDQIFEEMKELEEKKSEEALLIVQTKHDLWRYQIEKYEARRLQRAGNSRRAGREQRTAKMSDENEKKGAKRGKGKGRKKRTKGKC